MFNEAEQDRHDKLSETIESYKPSTSLGRGT
jgi:hypothetical protein